jgi:Mrp family chromosome partitioning ATPase
MMEELRKKYDYIVIDGVPNTMVADASIIDRTTDVTLFIVRVGRMDRRVLPVVERMYKTGALTNMCILLNGVRSTHGSYGYGYCYGYGYGYGYGNEKDAKKRRKFALLEKLKNKR